MPRETDRESRIDMSPESNALTIDEYLTYLAPEVWNDNWETLPAWPGDVFAIVASLLHRSGAYSGIGTEFWKDDGEDWETEARTIAAAWRQQLSGQLSGRFEEVEEVPAKLQEWWSVLCESFDEGISDIRKNSDLCEAIVQLCAVCDEVFEGVGVVPFSQLTDPARVTSRKNEVMFWQACLDLLEGEDMQSIDANGTSDPDDGIQDRIERDRPASLCRFISPSRARVMPKAQTPKLGLSIRSLTHYISLCPPTLLRASWVWHATTRPRIDDHYCNLLLFPWPFEVTPRQFSSADGECARHPNTGWFKYEPNDCSAWELAQKVEAYIDKAENEVGRVHVLVLPETALTDEQHEKIRSVAIERKIILVAGVAHRDVHSEQSRTHNCAAVTFPTYLETDEAAFQSSRYMQDKHHRWKLDHDQIVRYSLSAVLDSQKEWWENIPLPERSLNVFPIRDWLCTCPLICEDLARLDPAGQFVRAMSPDLVIALLFDGPQLATRWPAHYAGVLAEDPGSSVLTLTSLGMARLSRPVNHDPNRSTDVIGLWRDPMNGSVEIRLPTGRNAAVLTIQRKEISTATADGRTKNVNALAPVFGGLVYL